MSEVKEFKAEWVAPNSKWFFEIKGDKYGRDGLYCGPEWSRDTTAWSHDSDYPIPVFDGSVYRNKALGFEGHVIANIAIEEWQKEIDAITEETRKQDDEYYAETLQDWREKTNGITFIETHQHNQEMMQRKRSRAYEIQRAIRAWRDAN